MYFLQSFQWNTNWICKINRIKDAIFFSIVEKGGRRVDIALDLCSGWGRVHNH